MAHGRRPAGIAASCKYRDQSDNFWSMGDTGPCGPCSEIFYDHGDHIPRRPAGQCRMRTATGLSRSGTWSFMQYRAGRRIGERVALPRPSIDTGMGLERHHRGAAGQRTTTTTST